MAMTNAEKQKAHRKRTIDKIARYESALEKIQLVSVNDGNAALNMRWIALEALTAPSS